MDERLKKLIERLTKKSKENKAIWLKTGIEGFKIHFKAGTVVINCSYDECCMGVTVFNGDGHKIGGFEANEQCNVTGAFELLKGLYDSARNAFYKTDEVYRLLIDEVDRNDIIGEK
jgi:hypothetical protein